MSDVRGSRDGHVCFGCRKQIGDDEPHIHVPMDDFAARNGGQQFGLDDLLTFAFCKPCTVDAEDGWQLESHDVGSLPPLDAT
jgi:hypothetical protein